MYNLYKDIDKSLLRLVPKKGSLYNRLLNAYLSPGLSYSEFNYYIILSDIHFEMTGESEEYRQSETIIAKYLGIWYLRILANIGEDQFNAFIEMHPKLVENDDIIKLGLELYYSTHKLIKPGTVISSHIRSAIQGRHFTKNNRFVISNEPIFRAFCKDDYLFIINLLHNAFCNLNTSILNDILLYIDPWEVKKELPSKLKWLVGEFQRVENIKGNRQHYMYTYFSRLLMKYYAIHDPSVPEPKAVNPRLKLIKG